MKILNPTKLSSSKILIDKMSQYNTDEENAILQEQVKKHNQQTGDNLNYFELKKMRFKIELPSPVVDFKRSVIPERYEQDIKRYKK